MKKDLAKLMGGMLLGGVAMLALLAACGGSAGANGPAPAATRTTAAPIATATAPATAAPAPTATVAPAPTATATTAPVATPDPASPAASSDSDLLAQGKLLFEKTAGRVGCASCHGLDGKGNATVGAPDNRGATEAQLRRALAGGVAMMSFIKLTDEEIKAVVAYLKYLSEQP